MRGGHPASELERMFERLVHRHGVQRPDRQFCVGRYRVDYIYSAQKVWIELNGRKDHGKKSAFEADHERHNEIALELSDYLHLRFTWDQVTKGRAYVADVVVRALKRLTTE